MTDEGLNVETIRPLELLHRAAEQVGAVVCLTASSDPRNTVTGRRTRTLETGAQLRTLAVVKPLRAPACDRWEALKRGTMLCSVTLSGPARLDAAAQVLVDLLHEHIQRRAA